MKRARKKPPRVGFPASKHQLEIVASVMPHNAWPKRKRIRMITKGKR